MLFKNYILSTRPDQSTCTSGTNVGQCPGRVGPCHHQGVVKPHQVKPHQLPSTARRMRCASSGSERVANKGIRANSPGGGSANAVWACGSVRSGGWCAATAERQAAGQRLAGQYIGRPRGIVCDRVYQAKFCIGSSAPARLAGPQLLKQGPRRQQYLCKLSLLPARAHAASVYVAEPAGSETTLDRGDLAPHLVQAAPAGAARRPDGRGQGRRWRQARGRGSGGAAQRPFWKTFCEWLSPRSRLLGSA